MPQRSGARVDVRVGEGPFGAAVAAGLRGGVNVTVDVIVDAAIADHDELDANAGEAMMQATQALLAAAEQGQVEHIVLLSSALVYGAYPNNPIPLTEDMVLRPLPDFAYALQLAAAEQAVEMWRRARPGRSVSVLRPAIMVSADATAPLASALSAAYGQRFAETDPPAQFVHVDDVVRAIVHATERRLDGVYNVAPDGSVPGSRVRELSGQPLSLPLPESAVDVVADLRWRFQRGPIPPGLRLYTRHPWVIANDKLCATGWEPTVTNEQAYVEGTEAPWWTMVSPKRRQELALAGTFVTWLASTLASVGLLAWWMRGRR